MTDTARALDPETFIKAMEHAGPIWNRPITPELLEAYEEALSDIDTGVFLAALKEATRTARWFPTPAELRQAADRLLTEAGVYPLEPAAMWLHIESSLRAQGYARDLTVADLGLPEEAATAFLEVTRIRELAEANPYRRSEIRADFERAYSTYRTRLIRRLQGAALPAPRSARAIDRGGTGR